MPVNTWSKTAAPLISPPKFPTFSARLTAPRNLITISKPFPRRIIILYITGIYLILNPLRYQYQSFYASGEIGSVFIRAKRQLGRSPSAADFHLITLGTNSANVEESSALLITI